MKETLVTCDHEIVNRIIDAVVVIVAGILGIKSVGVGVLVVLSYFFVLQWRYENG